MFEKVLIANRGEIACRVLRSCQAMGVATVAVYSDADASAQHVLLADEAVRLGPAPARESYLLGEKIIAAAQRCGAQAIHPGYGFLSENADFARQCEAAGLVFIGPPANAIDTMGSKSAAKRIMETAGVPLVPGFHGHNPSPQELQRAADSMGYPVMLKAVHGGGGKGMRIVWHAKDLPAAADAARREAENAVGNGELLLEKYVTEPRHVEVQVFADQHGNAVYLAERDCSVQRRHQKVVEEAPAPGLSADLRQQLGEAAVRAAQAIDYVGAGTVEFLLDSEHRFYFIEMNTRLQVEHPVTEMITGLDLVAWQLQVASGEPLPLRQDAVTVSGHALEARIYAEDPDHGFLPATGQLQYLRPPSDSQHVRVDTGVIGGDAVSMYYDPMIAKLVVWDQDRPRALRRLARALADYHIAGVTTNIAFLRRIADHPAFVAGEVNTGFIDRYESELLPEPGPAARASALTAAVIHAGLHEQEHGAAVDTWQSLSGWRLNAAPQVHVEVRSPAGDEFAFTLRGEAPGSHTNARHFTALEPSSNEPSLVSVILEAETARVSHHGHQHTVAYWSQRLGSAREVTLFETSGPSKWVCQPASVRTAQTSDNHSLLAPMNGTVVSIMVTTGQVVTAGSPLLIMEAMKMEHCVRAPADGTVEQLYYRPGDAVSSGASLLAFAPTEEETTG